MLFAPLLGLAGFTAFAAAQGEPISWLDVNPPVEQSTIIHISGTATTYVGAADYLTTVTHTATLASETVTTTRALEWSIATITAASPGEEVGDLSVVITPKLKDAWQALAVQHCGAPAKRSMTKRSFASCALDFAADAAAREGSLDLIGPPVLPMVTANDVARAIQAGLAAGRIAASSEGFATLAAIALAVWFENGQKDMPEALRIPLASISATTTRVCPPAKETGKPANIICQDQVDCKGNDLHICTGGKWVECECADAFQPNFHPSWMDLDKQNDILASWKMWSDLVPTIPSTGQTPHCASNNYGMDPSIVNKLANVFCPNADFTKSSSQIVGGKDYDPPITIPGNNTASFNFRPWLPAASMMCTPQNCLDSIAKIMQTCEYDSHSFYGDGYQETPCGTFDVKIISGAAPTNTCSGPTTDGNAECNTKCSPRTGTCVVDSTQPQPTCRCN